MHLKEYLSSCPQKRVKIYSVIDKVITPLYAGDPKNISEEVSEYMGCTIKNEVICGSGSAIIYVDGKIQGSAPPELDQLNFFN